MATLVTYFSAEGTTAKVAKEFTLLMNNLLIARKTESGHLPRQILVL